MYWNGIWAALWAVCGRINRNMRCIEITRPIVVVNVPLIRLIETWDVLKYVYNCACWKNCIGLIETWDVLK